MRCANVVRLACLLVPIMELLTQNSIIEQGTPYLVYMYCTVPNQCMCRSLLCYVCKETYIEGDLYTLCPLLTMEQQAFVCLSLLNLSVEYLIPRNTQVQPNNQGIRWIVPVPRYVPIYLGRQVGIVACTDITVIMSMGPPVPKGSPSMVAVIIPRKVFVRILTNSHQVFCLF